MACRELNDEFVERVEPNARRRLQIRDKKMRELVLRVTPRGVKTFSYHYKVPGEGGVSARGRALKGKSRRVTIGQWPIVGVEQARDEVHALMKSVAKGRDPRPERKQKLESRFGNTVAALVERLTEVSKASIATWAKQEQVLRDYVVPDMGNGLCRR